MGKKKAFNPNENLEEPMAAVPETDSGDMAADLRREIVSTTEDPNVVVDVVENLRKRQVSFKYAVEMLMTFMTKIPDGITKYTERLPMGRAEKAALIAYLEENPELQKDEEALKIVKLARAQLGMRKNFGANFSIDETCIQEELD
jgi:hypothetical protein